MLKDRLYISIFLISLSNLALQIALTRLLSVSTWYYLAFFAISTSMLGLTGGAVLVYVKRDWFEQRARLSYNLFLFSLIYTLVIPVSLVVLCLIPLDIEKNLLAGVYAFGVATLVCVMPFVFAGTVISAAITRSRYPIGKLYASDLAGASVGCLFAVAGLELLDAASIILLCSAFGLLAAIFCVPKENFSTKRYKILKISFFIVFVISILNHLVPFGIRPFVIKGELENRDQILIERWNSLSRVTVYKETTSFPHFWGASPKTPPELRVSQHRMRIDGVAGTTLRRFRSFDDLEHLRYDLPNLVYYLRPTGGACIIGVGAGRDIQSALLFGHEQVVGIEINSIFINLLTKEFREFAGLADHPGVILVNDEARSYLSRDARQYSVIQMSLIDTWAATTSGSFSLSENSLYTTQAWHLIMRRLKHDGIFTVSRWYDSENLGETGRILSLAMAVLIESGVSNPSDHIAMAATKRTATLLLSKRPFSKQDIDTLKKVSDMLGFTLPVIPGQTPSNKDLRAILAARSLADLVASVADAPLNYTPPTDDNPYFFNMLRLDRPIIWDSVGGVVRGNIIANITLLILSGFLILFIILVIFVPLFVKNRPKNYIKSPATLAGASYFSLVGAGFMLVEIGLIQRLNNFVGHPTLTLASILSTLITGTGIGSLISERIAVDKPRVLLIPLIISLAILLLNGILSYIPTVFESETVFIKILMSMLLILPLGILMGLCLPLGVRLTLAISDFSLPWYWALNGAFSVLSSVAAIIISIYIGISFNFYLSACLYILLIPCKSLLLRNC